MQARRRDTRAERQRRRILSYLHWLALLAQSNAQGKGGGQQVPGCMGGGMAQMVPILLMFVVFYFLLIRPQQKKAKEHQTMLQNLKRGDQIVTTGGMLGKITGLDDRMCTLEVAEKIRLRILRSHIAGKQGSVEAEEQPKQQS
jgi:preprotein translocase subunit YajC